VSILDHFPKGYTPRPSQAKVLREVEAAWGRSRVIVIDADVGSGKSHILQTIARWRKAHEESTATITHRVSLQDQYTSTFPSVDVLRGKSRYKCSSELFRSCHEAFDVQGEYCSGCKYASDKSKALTTRNGVFSIHSYLLLQSRKTNLLIDEAHALFNIMSDQCSVKLWRNKVNYPANLKDMGDVRRWLEEAIAMYSEELEEAKQHVQRLRAEDAVKESLIPWLTSVNELEGTVRRFRRVLEGIKHRPTDFFVEHITAEHRGKLQPALQIRPMNLVGMMNWLWPKDTKKIVMTSATLSPADIDKLGLMGEKIKWLKADPVIPAKVRPIKPEFAGNMSFSFQDKALPKISQKVLELQARHADTKGIVHAPYAVAKKMKALIGQEKNIIWHEKKDKEKKLAEFMAAPAGTVMVASGMSEGIDLSGAEFGWQALAKVPWPSKADQLISQWYADDMDWIIWLTTREILQACGRVNRHESDYAITYLLDTNFGSIRRRRRGFLSQFKSRLPEEFLKRIQE